MEPKQPSSPNLRDLFYRSLYRIRRVEEEIVRVYPSDKIQSPVHLSIGQEAVSVGICEALESRDAVFGTYRGHAMYLAKGGSLPKMIAELYGKVTGCAKGKGGSMHLVDVESGVMGTSAIVATTIPIATGYAQGLQLQGRDSIVAVFFGEGAVDEGVFHESMNYAALHGLPILFVCENNFYAIHSPQLSRQKTANLVERARSYGMEAERIEGNEVVRIYERASHWVDRLRHGKGPVFLECMTYRWREHVGPGEDFHLGYRTREEARAWVEGDPLIRLARELPASKRLAIEESTEAEIRAAFEFADKSPVPAKEDLFAGVFKEK